MLSSEKCMQKANPVDGILHAHDQSLIFFYSVFSLFTVCCLFSVWYGFLSFRANVVAFLRGLRRALLKVPYVSVRTHRSSCAQFNMDSYDGLPFLKGFPCHAEYSMCLLWIVWIECIFIRCLLKHLLHMYEIEAPHLSWEIDSDGVSKHCLCGYILVTTC